MAIRPLNQYLLTLPERLVRSAAGLAAGLVREVSEVSLPKALRTTRLYGNLVDSTLRFLIEQVGQVEGVYPASDKLAEDYALRRTAGNGIEVAGVLAFRASPVWVLAALADLSGAGRHLVREIAASLQQGGLLDPETRFETVDQVLDGLERTSGRLAAVINTPPLDVEALRREWESVKSDARAIPAPDAGALERLWREMNREAQAQHRNVFELSSLMALSAARRAPEQLRWLSRSGTVAARRTGEILGETLLGHYRETLEEIREMGYLAYWKREFRPYLLAAASQFQPGRDTLTGRLLKSR